MGVSLQNITVTNTSNSLTFVVASSLVCTSPLAVITVVGLLDVLVVSNSAELRSFLLTICILAPESTANYLSSRSFVEAAGCTHSSEGAWNGALSFELVYVFGKIPCLALGASLLSVSLFLRSVLKFHSVGTSLMRNFDLLIPKREHPPTLKANDARRTRRLVARGTKKLVAATLITEFKENLTQRFRKKDTNRKEILKRLVQQSENHPNRDSLKEDLSKTEEFNPFSEKSKELEKLCLRSCVPVNTRRPVHLTCDTPLPHSSPVKGNVSFQHH